MWFRLRRDRVIESITLLVLTLSVSYVVLGAVRVEPTLLGEKILLHWCQLRGFYGGSCLREMLSEKTLFEQALSLSLFITVIALTVISMKLRYFAAIFAVFALAFLGVVPPQDLVSGVEWRLVVFLIGAMILAFILRSLGVFRYIVLKILRVCRGSPTAFLTILALISWFLAIAVDEATSIVYVTMLLLDLKKLTGKDVSPLVVYSVLATNTGSMAMPIGNPIGIYLAFSTGLHGGDFAKVALPLSLLTLVPLILVTRALLKQYLLDVVKSITVDRVQVLYAEFYTMIDRRGKTSVTYGLALLVGFLLAVSTSNIIAESMSKAYGYALDAHALLAFIPYIFVFLSLEWYEPERLETALLRGVEWPSLFFFIALFMLGYSLLYSGVATKIAYLISALLPALGELFVKEVLLVTTAATSAVLDNLSVVVAFTPVASSLVYGGVSRSIYWTLLYGGTLGGNFTPIGSTANIVALGLCDKARIRISWASWLRVALVPTLIQIIIAVVWTTFLT